MSEAPAYNVAVLAGDGIGPEVVHPTLSLLDDVVRQMGGFSLRYLPIDAGAGHFEKTGVSIPDASLAIAREVDAILLGAMGLPHIRYPDGTEIAPQLELRVKLGLYAGVRPVRTIPGVPSPLSDARGADLDFVIVRESTEGLFKSRDNCEMIGDDIARDTMEITRSTSERLFNFAFELAARRKQNGTEGKLTCVDKSNVLGSFAFFRNIFDRTAPLYPTVKADHAYIDAVGYWLVTQPWIFDVLVTENMFGDIISDVGAGLMGGMGMAPSADIGDRHAIFQPCHGSAPDIAGQGKANPVATVLSAAMMLNWLGEENGNEDCCRAGRLLSDAVDNAFSDGDLLPFELGGHAGTEDIVYAIKAALETTG